MRVAKKRLSNADLLRGNIPEGYWRVRYDAIPNHAPYKKEVGVFLRDADQEIEAGHGIFLTHPKNGTGKTGIACLIAKRALHLGFTVYYTMAESYKNAVVRDLMFDEFQKVYDRVRGVDLLIVDDFGKEHKGKSGWIEGELENLIRERVQMGKSTILTSNLIPKDLSTHYSKDFASVLKQACYTLLIPGSEQGGKDWRNDGKLGSLKSRVSQMEE